MARGGGGVALTEVESNNTAATANDFAAIAVNGRVSAAIGTAGDNDFFSLTIPAGATALYITTFSTGVDTICATANTTLTLIAADGDDHAGEQHQHLGHASSARTSPTPRRRGPISSA